jgi:hypothetical protein
VQEETALQAKSLAAAEGQIESLKNECAARTRETDASNSEALSISVAPPYHFHLLHVFLRRDSSLILLIFSTFYATVLTFCTFYVCIIMIPLAFGTGVAEEAKKVTTEMKKRMLDALKEAERVTDLERLLSGTRNDADKNQVSTLTVLSTRCCS